MKGLWDGPVGGLICLLLLAAILGGVIALGMIFGETTTYVDNTWMQYLPEPLAER